MSTVLSKPGACPSARRRCRNEPGIENTHCTSTMFVTMIGAEAPNSDATVAKVGGAACRRTTRPCGTPLARAVRTHSSPIASTVSISVSRRIAAPSGAPATSHGTSRERAKSHGLSSGGA
jgi:hypothetical protein